MFTDKEFFDFEVKQGYTQNNQAYAQLHREFGSYIIDSFKTQDKLALMDIGCGTGAMIEYLIYQGVDAWGITSNKYERNFFVERNSRYEDHVILADASELLRVSPLGYYDVITAIECFEHMDDETIEKTTKAIKMLTSYFIFSSMPDEQPDLDGDIGHINVRSTDDWIKYFKKYGFNLVKRLDKPTTWTLLFEKR